MGRGLFGEDFWVDLMAHRVAQTAPPGGIVFTDVRFPNEAHRVRAGFGGLVVQVVRPDVETLAGDVARHASEAMAFEPDLVVCNDGTVDDLGRRVAAAIGLT
jgi:hypothetical protein